MNKRAQIRLLLDGRRLHLSDGPIDLIVEAFGASGEIRRSYEAACRRFASILDELCSELAFYGRPAAQSRSGLVAVSLDA